MLLATLLSLGAAVLHAGWNLAAKRATGDVYLTLWAQFTMAAAIAAPLMVVHHVVWGMAWQGYAWAAVSGAIHLPYVWLLSRAYSIGEFSVSYPIARGAGAALAAVLGVVLLSDELGALQVGGIALAVVGMVLLARGADGRHVLTALAIALTVGAYTIADAKGARATATAAYVFPSFVGSMASNTLFSLARGRAGEMSAHLRATWRRSLLTGTASLVTYGMVLIAVRRAPVGYVTALRESSVIIAAFAGWRLLGEGDHRRRIVAAVVVFAGLVVLVVGG